MAEPTIAEADQPVFIYTTFPDMGEAERVGGQLVGERLAACVNMMPGMTSIYEWEDKLEKAAEVSAIVKTRRGMAQQAMERLQELHPYDTPAVILLPTEGGSADYCAWIAKMTRPE